MDPPSIALGVAASKEGLAAVVEFTRRLLGPGTDQLGLMVGDWARLWRVKQPALNQGNI